MAFAFWFAAAIRFISAIFAASSVNADSSNAGKMMILTLLFLAWAVVDAFAAISVGERKEDEVKYIGGRRNEHK